MDKLDDSPVTVADYGAQAGGGATDGEKGGGLRPGLAEGSGAPGCS